MTPNEILFEEVLSPLRDSSTVRAGELAPYDFTIRPQIDAATRAGSVRRPFFELYEEWEAVGRPYYTEPVDGAQGK